MQLPVRGSICAGEELFKLLGLSDKQPYRRELAAESAPEEWVPNQQEMWNYMGETNLTSHPERRLVLWLTIWKLEHNRLKIEVKGQTFWSRIKTIFFYLQ